MKTLLAAALLATTFTASANESLHIESYGHDRYGSYSEFDENLPFMVVRNYVKNMYPEIDDRLIIVDLIQDDIWQVTIIMSSSTKVFNIKLDKKL